jgi:hypothetical protein
MEYSKEELNRVMGLLDVGHIVIVKGNADFIGQEGVLRYLEKTGLVKLKKEDPGTVVGAVLSEPGKLRMKNGGF